MKARFRLAAVVLVLALLAQPVAVIAECVSMPARECPGPETPDMHCPPPSQVQAQEPSVCCQVESAPAAPSKAPVVAADLAAGKISAKARILATVPLMGDAGNPALLGASPPGIWLASPSPPGPPAGISTILRI